MNKIYLREAMKGDYRYRSEDRLTQIFAASFNSSKAFRRAVIEFLDCGRKRPSTCETQDFFAAKENCRPDILLQGDDQKPLVVIENKIDAPFSPNQLTKYANIEAISRCGKFCFIKHYKAVSEIEKGWKLKYWANFYVHLRHIPEKNRDLIIDNFITILEDYGMNNPLTIKKADLKRLSKALHNINHEKQVSACDVFETVFDLKKMFEDLFRRAAKIGVVKKRAKKAFRPNTQLTWWWEKNGKKSEKIFWIGCDTSLLKLYNGATGFGAAFFLNDTTGKYDLSAYMIEKNGDMRENEWTYPKKDVDCQDFADRAIKYWESELK